ncbi:MAG: hypothetical protein IPK35_09505 [Saprospiraceae bacterium]|jgi:hypothetical protein|nr:hypothetical protein [Saprospiraceae bacterium]
MKSKLKPSLYFGLIFMVSISCTIYLQSQDFFEYHDLMPVDFTETYVMENSELPDLNFLKEVLKSIFNIINLA